MACLQLCFLQSTSRQETLSSLTSFSSRSSSSLHFLKRKGSNHHHHHHSPLLAFPCGHVGKARGVSYKRLSASHCPHRRTSVIVMAAGVAGQSIGELGVASVLGTSRRRNEDRFSIDAEGAEASLPYFAVFDGHGGDACSDWLSQNFVNYVRKEFDSGSALDGSPESAITDAFLAADKKILQPKGGLFGAMGERGIGGSKCGATAAVALLVNGGGGKRFLLAANAGDARVLLARGKEVLQLTEDHVPDMEEERLRIEAQNPNPNMPLVRYVGGTWRVGGLLALSRAFGDAYLKGTGQFEGVPAGSDGYSSGFGVIAEPSVTLTELSEEDRWVVISSDGLYANEERGGGGGLSNDEVIKMCDSLSSKSCNEIAAALADAAAESGSTDDITVLVLRLK